MRSHFVQRNYLRLLGTFFEEIPALAKVPGLEVQCVDVEIRDEDVPGLPLRSVA